MRILTRGGHDWTHRFPGIEADAKRLGVGSAILDGEAVILDEIGRSNFGKLQQSLGGRGGKLNSGASIMFAFDILYFDGHDIRSLELTARRYFLQSLLKNETGAPGSCCLFCTILSPVPAGALIALKVVNVFPLNPDQLSAQAEIGELTGGRAYSGHDVLDIAGALQATSA